MLFISLFCSSTPSFSQNYHVAATWSMLRQDRFNFWRKLPQKSLDQVRKIVIDMVLSTDMKQVKRAVWSAWPQLGAGESFPSRL